MAHINNQSQKFLSNLKITGKTASGETKELEVKKLPAEPQLAAEYLLINHNPNGGVEMKARLLDAAHPTEKEKLIFMLGEACYAIAHKYQESDFESFMRELTRTVQEFHN